MPVAHGGALWTVIVKEAAGKEIFLSPRYSCRDEAKAHCEAISSIRARGGASVRVALCGPGNVILSDALFSAVGKVESANQGVATAHETVAHAKSLLHAAERGLADAKAIGQCIDNLSKFCDVHLSNRVVDAYHELDKELLRLWSADMTGLGPFGGGEAEAFRDALLASNQRAALVARLQAMAVQIRRSESGTARRAPREALRGKSTSNHRYIVQRTSQSLSAGKGKNGLQKGLPNLLALSVSQDAKIAMSEWEWSGEEIDSTDKQFPEWCEFCHAKGIEKAFRVVNSQNGNSVWVGSECVIRYARSGAASMEESRDKFRFDRRQQQRLQTIRRVVRLLLSDPEHKLRWEDFEALHKCVHGYFDVRNTADLQNGGAYHTYMSEIVEAPWNAYAGDAETAADARLVYLALFDPATILRESPREKSKDYRQYIGGRSRRVTTTIARGEHTRPADYGIGR